MNPRRPLREHIAQLALLGKTAAQNHGNVRVQRAELVENRVAVHDREEKIEDDQTDLFADLLVNSERFETVAREDDLDSLRRSASRKPVRQFRVSSSTSRISSRLPFCIQHLDVRRDRTGLGRVASGFRGGEL